MKVAVPDFVLNNMLAEIEEGDRLETLSNEELVIEYLKLRRDQDDELHVNEMMNRLFPEWDQVKLGNYILDSRTEI